jgi:integrator complex subunit 1
VEKTITRLITTNIPLQEETITRLVLICLNKLPLARPEALEILEILVRRAATLDSQKSEDAMNIRESQLVEAILQLSLYQPPNISDQDLKQFPQFAVAPWFWQACLILGKFHA